VATNGSETGRKLVPIPKGADREPSVVSYPKKILKIGEEEIMKKFMVCLGILVLILVYGGMARAETFDFNRGLNLSGWDGTGLQPNANATQISSYMTGIYGATVTVAATGSPVSNGIFDFLLGGLSDGYLESEQSGTHTIQISFSVPITSVSFDWARLLDPFNADYSLNGTDWTNFFHRDYGILNTGNLSTVTFASPVIALKFHDSGSGEVAIDNLVVEKSVTSPVPEPATMFLLGSGLVGLAGFARRRFKK
jgi:hypothetical protein